jgi:predicted amidohydrolase
VTTPDTLRIGLATVKNYPDLNDRMESVERMLAQASAQQVAIVCFPETYLPGLRGMDFPVPPPDQARQAAFLSQVMEMSARHRVATIMGMEWQTDLGLHNLAFVVNADGAMQGYQAKNQLPLEESPFYVPDGKRRVFEVQGVPFGITICHEGWRYPEATRWAAARGARVVFHPHLTGSDATGPTLTKWGDPTAPYYEKAMVMRSVENTIYFASVNTALRYQESATSVIDPQGNLFAHAPYGQETLLVCDLELTGRDRADGFALRSGALPHGLGSTARPQPVYELVPLLQQGRYGRP